MKIYEYKKSEFLYRRLIRYGCMFNHMQAKLFSVAQKINEDGELTSSQLKELLKEFEELKVEAENVAKHFGDKMDWVSSKIEKHIKNK